MMKGPLFFLFIAIAACCTLGFRVNAAPSGDSPQFANTLVEPGLSVGPLKIGDSPRPCFRNFSQEGQGSGVGRPLWDHCRLD